MVAAILRLTQLNSMFMPERFTTSFDMDRGAGGADDPSEHAQGMAFAGIRFHSADLLRGLAMVIKSPAPWRIRVRRIEDGPFEESIVHGSFIS